MEGVVPPEPVQGLSGSPGSGLKKPPRSLGRRGRESQRAGMPSPTPDKLPRVPRPLPCPNRGQSLARQQREGLPQQHPRVQGSLPRRGPTGGKGLPTEVKHKYQPRIQEWGLAEARVRVHWAAGGEIAQRESTYKTQRIREREQAAQSRGKLGGTCPPSLQTTPIGSP